MELDHKKSIAGGIIAFIIATSCCWLPVLAIAVGGTSGLLGFNEKLEKYSWLFMALGIGMFGYGIFQLIKNKNAKMTTNLFSTITCPKCGYKKEEIMPVNACYYFYECEGCKEILKPKRGDCCVFCSYGTEVCPPVQEGRECC